VKILLMVKGGEMSAKPVAIITSPSRGHDESATVTDTQSKQSLPRSRRKVPNRSRSCVFSTIT